MKKNYARPSIEQERAALTWSTEYFRRFKADLEKGIPDEFHKQCADFAVKMYDSWGENAAGNTNPLLGAADATVNGVKNGPYKLAGFTLTDSDVDGFLRRTCATLMERDKQLPAPLASFVAASLREPNQPSSPGRKGTDLFNRYATIGIAVDYVMRTWGFMATRNRYNTKGVCAVSIVKDAVAAGANLHLSEAEIIQASKRYRRLGTILKSGASPKLRTLMESAPDTVMDPPARKAIEDQLIKSLTSLGRRKI